eukprot:Filipodium_phascolosomae@DN7841_c0_g1_i1.p1
MLFHQMYFNFSELAGAMCLPALMLQLPRHTQCISPTTLSTVSTEPEDPDITPNKNSHSDTSATPSVGNSNTVASGAGSEMDSQQHKAAVTDINSQLLIRYNCAFVLFSISLTHFISVAPTEFWDMLMHNTQGKRGVSRDMALLSSDVTYLIFCGYELYHNFYTYAPNQWVVWRNGPFDIHKSVVWKSFQKWFRRGNSALQGSIDIGRMIVSHIFAVWLVMMICLLFERAMIMVDSKVSIRLENWVTGQTANF